MTKNELDSQLTNESIRKVRDFLMKTLDSTNDRGEPDLEKIIHNATYNMGEYAIEIAGLVMQEKLKLSKLEEAYRRKKKKQYEALMGTRGMGWTPTQEGVRIMIDGDESVDPDVDDDIPMNQLQSKIARQQEYIDFLKAAQEQIRYYPKNAKYLIEISQFGREIGKII